MKKQTFIQPGDKFGRLTAIRYSHTGKHHRRYFLFSCDCGKETTITAEAATSGNTKSCGCLARESKKAQLLPDNRGVINQIILGYKRHARDRGFQYLLTFEKTKEVINQNCWYCGIPPSNIKITKNCIEGFSYNGIDRIDSSKDYTVENVVACCRLCNLAKRDMTIQEFYEWVLRISAMAEQWGKL
jgi:hypothetical protein